MTSIHHSQGQNNDNQFLMPDILATVITVLHYHQDIYWSVIYIAYIAYWSANVDLVNFTVKKFLLFWNL